MVILMIRHMAIVMITLSADIPLGIRWDVSIVLVICKWMMVVVMPLVMLVLIRMHIVIER